MLPPKCLHVDSAPSQLFAEGYYVGSTCVYNDTTMLREWIEKSAWEHRHLLRDVRFMSKEKSRFESRFLRCTAPLPFVVGYVETQIVMKLQEADDADLDQRYSRRRADRAWR